ncbi:MAG TPA: MFS transporter, partial [Deinococcales bacterium]|nr:MFS transporter [Deinococcales bacterium]
PFIVGGVALNLVGLGIMVFAPGFWTYALGYLFVQLGNNVATSPFNALIPDVVPEAERGAASGVMGVLTLTGQITGFAINIALSSSRSGQFLAIAVLLAASALISVLGTPEPKRHAVSVERPDWLAFLRPEYRDFRWVTLTRFFNEVGKYSVQPFLNYYLADVIAAFTIGGFVIANKDMATSLVAGLLTVSGAVTAVWGGNVSDRVGKKPIIYLAGGLMGAAALGFALAHTYALVLVFAVVFGLGYGAYMSVDWALGTAVLPNRRTLARDMGVWHIAMVLPQVFNAAEGRFLDWGNAQSPNLGYSLIFGVAILFFLFGTVFIAQVRGVK